MILQKDIGEPNSLIRAQTLLENLRKVKDFQAACLYVLQSHAAAKCAIREG